MEVKKIQHFLRIMAILVLACLVGLDTQTKPVFNILEEKATYKDLDALFVLVHVVSVAAGYNLLQLGLEILTANLLKGSSKSHGLPVFATSSAALQASMLAVAGAESLQWMKLCSIFTRFCYQVSGGLVCSFTAWFIMATVSSISALTLSVAYIPLTTSCS